MDGAASVNLCDGNRVITLEGVPIPQAIHDVARRLQKIPGVGEKTALRYAIFLAGHGDLPGLAEALEVVALTVRPCATCNALADAGGCPYCERAAPIVCVVHRYQDLLAVERAAPAKMRYFVLDALLSPLDGIQAEDLPLDALRSQVDGAEEVVLALPPSTEGEATALFLGRELAAVNVTRLARGLPHGGNVEFADAITLRGAFDERARVK